MLDIYKSKDIYYIYFKSNVGKCKNGEHFSRDNTQDLCCATTYNFPDQCADLTVPDFHCQFKQRNTDFTLPGVGTDADIPT